jgi:quinoprotein relay system zinc metallohydrolase 2
MTMSGAPGRRLLRIGTLAAVLAVNLATARAEPDIEPLPVREVAEGVFVYQAPYALAAPGNDGAIANMGFVVGRDAVAVIDTGNSFRAGARLEAAVRAHTALPIRYVINTHMHPDHVLGNAAFAPQADRDRDSAAARVRFVGHHKLPRALATRADTYLAAARRLVGEEAFAGTRIIAPDILVPDKLVLDLGERALELEAWPTAHTDNDLTVLDVRTGTWFLGDLLFVGHVPALDGSIRGWLGLMRDLRMRPAARVVPGHGPASVSWPGAMEPQMRYLARLEAEVRRLLREGRTMAEAAAETGLDERDGWALFDEFNARNATAVYHELEWE